MSADTDAKTAELRTLAASHKNDDDPLVSYLANWLVFFIDAHASTVESWRASIDAIGHEHKAHS